MKSWVKWLLILLVPVLLGSSAWLPHRRKAFRSSFDPTSISGIQLWFAADQAELSGYTNGQSVATWTDYSGNGWNATQSRTQWRPSFTNNAVGTKPAIFFNGVNLTSTNAFSLEETGATNALRDVSGGTLFMVAYCASPSVTAHPIHIGKGTGGETFARFLAYITASTMAVGGRRGDGDSFQASDSFSLPAINQIFSIVGDYGNSAAYIWTNGVAAVSDSTWLTDGLTSDTGSIGMSIGATTISFSGGQYQSPWKGTIAEIILYNSALSDADRQSVEGYLSAKYGL